jgi:hypothetical protein
MLKKSRISWKLMKLTELSELAKSTQGILRMRDMTVIMGSIIKLRSLQNNSYLYLSNCPILLAISRQGGPSSHQNDSKSTVTEGSMPLASSECIHIVGS